MQNVKNCNVGSGNSGYRFNGGRGVLGSINLAFTNSLSNYINICGGAWIMSNIIELAERLIYNISIINEDEEVEAVLGADTRLRVVRNFHKSRLYGWVIYYLWDGDLVFLDSRDTKLEAIYVKSEIEVAISNRDYSYQLPVQNVKVGWKWWVKYVWKACKFKVNKNSKKLE